MAGKNCIMRSSIFVFFIRYCGYQIKTDEIGRAWERRDMHAK
jgi:hypothetical protein